MEQLFAPLDADTPAESLATLPGEEAPWEQVRAAARRLTALGAVQRQQLATAAQGLRASQVALRRAPSAARRRGLEAAVRGFRASQAALERLLAVARALERRAEALELQVSG